MLQYAMYVVRRFKAELEIQDIDGSGWEAIVTRVLAEQSGIRVRLLAGAHICLCRTAKGLVVGPTERPVPLAVEKELPHLQADF
jgi:hypothetical protein